MIEHRDGFENTVFDGDADCLGIPPPLAQKPVIEAGPIAQPPSLEVEGQAGGQEDVDLMERDDRPRIHRLLHSERMCLPGSITITERERPVWLDPGQNPAPSRQTVEQQPDVYLPGHSEKGGDGPWQSLRHPCEETFRHITARFGGDGTLAPHLLPKLLFVHEPGG